MKEIIAIIRLNKYRSVIDAMEEKGFSAFTVKDVMGRGKKMRQMFTYDGEIIENERGYSPLIPKKLLLYYVKDEDKETVVNTLIQVNQTGNVGDGKIFVSSVDEMESIRVAN